MTALLEFVQSKLGIACLGMVLVVAVYGIQEIRVLGWQAAFHAAQASYEREAAAARVQRGETRRAADANRELEAAIVAANHEIAELERVSLEATSRASAAAAAVVAQAAARRAARQAGSGPAYLQARQEEIAHVQP